MKITRGQIIETTEYKVGDVIDFTLKTGEEASAMVMRVDDAGALFVFKDCLEKEYPMNKRNTTMGGYAESDLRKVLNTEILESFPDELREQMKAFDSGDYLRLLSEMEVFGEQYFSTEKDENKQLEPMKDRRNRIAFQGKDTDRWEWWWLSAVASAAYFCFCVYGGGAYYTGASDARGVRPAFLI